MTTPTEATDDLKKESLSEGMALLKEKGVPVLRKRLENITTMNPLSFIIEGEEKQVPEVDIFSGMQLEREGKKKEIMLQDLVNIASDDAKSVLMLKGDAGVGKTSLMKSLANNWANKTGAVNGLDAFDLVLYMDCRDHIETFQELLENSLGDVHQSFKDVELVKTTLALKCMVILGEYDRINLHSSKLFQEILSLKRQHSLSIIVTARPEAEQKFREQVENADLNAVTIGLIGIEGNKKEEFIRKFFLNLTENSPPIQGLDGLLEYLKKSEHTMSGVWKSPYNLSTLAVLWMLKPDIVGRIATEAELHGQFHIITISKLEEKLQTFPSLSKESSSVLKKKIQQFLEQLSWQSLVGLKKDDIYLSKEVQQMLADLCLHLELPLEEMASTFLKKVTVSNEVLYTYPHKGIQEFLAAYNIYMQVTGQGSQSEELKKKWTDELSKTSIPRHIQYIMLDAVEKQETLTAIFKKLYGGFLPESLCKYQQLLLNTLTVFNFCEGRVTNETKIEVLNLLGMSGIKDKGAWLSVLHRSKCDDFTVKWIVEKHQILHGKIDIGDRNFNAYIALFNAMAKPSPIRNEQDTTINLSWMRHNVIEELAQGLSKHEVKVKIMYLHSLFKRESHNISPSEKEAIQVLYKNCSWYLGIWNTEFQISSELSYLWVGLPDHKTMDAFLTSLSTAKGIEKIGISFGPEVHPPSPTKTIPQWISVATVRINHVKSEEEAGKVADILRAFNTSFWRIHFAGNCSLGPKELVQALHDVQVTGVILFHTSRRPNDRQEAQEISEIAMTLTGSRVDWMNAEYIF